LPLPVNVTSQAISASFLPSPTTSWPAATTKTKTARGRSNGDDNRGASQVRRDFLLLIALFTDYTKTTEVREAARRVSTPSSFHCHCTTKRQPSQAPATTGDRQQNKREERRCCEEVPTSSQHRSSLFDTARNIPPPSLETRDGGVFALLRAAPTWPHQPSPSTKHIKHACWRVLRVRRLPHPAHPVDHP
jgi:hypothetical protein